MNSNFQIERLWLPAGEGSGKVANNTHLLSMADSQTTFVEWRADGSLKRKRERVFSGDMWVCPQGQTWWARREAEKTSLQLSISSEWLCQLTHSSVEVLPQVQLRDLLLAQMLRTLAGTAKELPQSPTTTLYQESLVTTLVLHLVTHYGQISEKQSGVKQNSVTPLSTIKLRTICDYASEHISETISLAELAEITGLSAAQFSIRFRDTTGQTPHQYITSMRLDKARELLAEGNHSTGAIALLTGFADQSHLTRHIRRAFGVTPGVLKRK